MCLFSHVLFFSPPPPSLLSSPHVLFRPVHGLIFLYKWRSEEPAQGSVVQDSRLEDIFFAKQVTCTFDVNNYVIHTFREEGEREREGERREEREREMCVLM